MSIPGSRTVAAIHAASGLAAVLAAGLAIVVLAIWMLCAPVRAIFDVAPLDVLRALFQ